MIFLFFFFSSRRRHTRYWRDWSSDVCSSDLKPVLEDDGRCGGEAHPPSVRTTRGAPPGRRRTDREGPPDPDRRPVIDVLPDGWLPDGLTSATLALVLLAGLAAGFIDAVVGGGGLLQLPALLLVPGMSPVQSLATNKLGSIF